MKIGSICKNTFLIVVLHIAVQIFVLTISGHGSFTRAGCGTPPDPRYNPGDYEAWCSCMGGTVYNDSRGYGCDRSGGPSGGAPHSGGYTDPSMQLMQQMFEGLGQALGRQMQNMLDPNSPDNLRRQQQEEQNAAIQQRTQTREERRKKEDKQRRQAFEESKRNMLTMFRGRQADNLQTENSGRSVKLKLREENDIFGQKTLKPRDLSKSSRVSTTDRNFTLHCVDYLLIKAHTAAAQGYFNEAAYLSNEAADLISGAKSALRVKCPEPPEFEAGPVEQSLAMQEKIKTRAVLLSRLYSRATQQMGDYGVILESIQETEARTAEAKAKQLAMEEELLKAQAQETSQASADTSALAEALAALEAAQDVYEESEKNLLELQKAKEAMQNRMKETRDQFEKIDDQPDTRDADGGKIGDARK